VVVFPVPPLKLMIAIFLNQLSPFLFNKSLHF